MNEQKNSIMGGPAKEQAPTPSTDSTTQTPPPATNSSAIDNLVPDYLSGGYHKGNEKARYIDPALVDQAEVIGKALAANGVRSTTLNKMVRTLKVAKRLPYEAQEGALKKLMPQILGLEQKKKSPVLLREVVERNRTAVQNEADFAACLDHIQDIAVFLAASQK